MRKKISLIILIIIISGLFCVTSEASMKELNNGKFWLYFTANNEAGYKDNLLETQREKDDSGDYSVVEDPSIGNYYKDEEELGAEKLNEIYKNNIEESLIYDKKDFYRYDILGYVENGWKSTTFANFGYYSMLKVNDNTIKPMAFNGEVIDGIENDINCSFVNNGNYVKVEYVLKNVGTEDKKISLGCFADIQIGHNDCAKVERLNDDKGLRLYDTVKNIQFVFLGKKVDNVTDIDNLWIGIYPEEQVHFFNGNQIQELEQYDTSMTFSWVNRTIKPDETQRYSVLYGIGSITSNPVVSFENEEDEHFSNNDIKINGSVSDGDDDSKAVIYYKIDDLEENRTEEYELQNNKYNYQIDLSKFNLENGKHHIQIWAVDDQGNISNTIEKDFYIDSIIAPVINMSEDWSNKDVKFYLTDEDVQNAKTYQYKIDEGLWQSINLNEEKIALSKTGTAKVYAKAVYNDGTESAVVMKTAKVDKENPEVSSYVKNKLIYINAEDKHSGIDKILYLLNDKKDVSEDDEFKSYDTAISNTYPESKNKLYLHVKAYDKVGNQIEHTQEFIAPEPASIVCGERYKDTEPRFKLTDAKSKEQSEFEYMVRLNGGDWKTVSIDIYYNIKNPILGENKIETKTIDLLGRESDINSFTCTYETAKKETTPETTNTNTKIETEEEPKQTTFPSKTEYNEEDESEPDEPDEPAKTVERKEVSVQSTQLKTSKDETITKNVIPKAGKTKLEIGIIFFIVISLITYIKYKKLKIK